MDLNKKKLRQSLIILVTIISIYIVIIAPASQPQDQNGLLSETQIFSEIYSNKKWRGGGSGPGSKPQNSIAYMAMLRGFISNNSIKTIADLGCGDWMLMEKIKVPNDKIYNGFDLVDSVIDANTSKYSAENIKFVKIENINDFINVKADLLIVKDVLQHWPNSQVEMFLEKILPNFKYALITNDYLSFMPNLDIPLGGFRTLDLQSRPFSKITDNINLKFFMDYSSHGATKRVYLFENPEPFVFH